MRETKIKLFASDMDGTLLQKDFTISEANINAIKRLQKRGIYFVIATGRTYYDAKTICERHRLMPYIISNNGTCLYSANGELLYSRPIQRDILEQLMQYLEQSGICYGIGTSRHYITSAHWENVLDEEVKHLKERGIEIPFKQVEFAKKELVLQNGIMFVENMSEFANITEIAYSVSIVTFDQEKAERVKKKMEEYETLMHVTSGPYNVEITEKRGNKGIALEHLCSLLHLEAEQVAAVGDSLNDICMMEKAGMKIAVENAREEMKAVCDFITKSHTCDGVAYAINKLINEEVGLGGLGSDTNNCDGTW